eukprot:2372119-Pleurochrysis_carterae.AAC.2
MEVSKKSDDEAAASDARARVRARANTRARTHARTHPHTHTPAHARTHARTHPRAHTHAHARANSLLPQRTVQPFICGLVLCSHLDASGRPTVTPLVTRLVAITTIPDFVENHPRARAFLRDHPNHRDDWSIHWPFPKSPANSCARFSARSRVSAGAIGATSGHGAEGAPRADLLCHRFSLSF